MTLIFLKNSFTILQLLQQGLPFAGTLVIYEWTKINVSATNFYLITFFMCSIFVVYKHHYSSLSGGLCSGMVRSLLTWHNYICLLKILFNGAKKFASSFPSTSLSLDTQSLICRDDF